MDLNFSVEDQIAEATKGIFFLLPGELDKVVAHGMNKTMATIRAQERKEMERVFDRPRPFTLNSFFTVPANAQRQQVEIRLKDNAGKGTPAAKYLAAQVYGGNRRLKGFERALQSAGILPQGMYAVPAKELPLDQHGNIPGSYLVQILSYLRAFGEVGYTANRARNAKRATRRRFYVVNGTTLAGDARGLPMGVYERKAGGPSRMVIAFVKAPSYKIRYDFFKVAEETTKRFLVGDIRAVAEEAQRKKMQGISTALKGSIIDLLSS